MYIALPPVMTYLGTEETVNDRVGCRVETAQALEEDGNGHLLLAVWEVLVYIQQVKDEVRAPANDEH